MFLLRNKKKYFSVILDIPSHLELCKTFSVKRYLMAKLHFNKGISICYMHRNFLKVSSINEGVIVFSK